MVAQQLRQRIRGMSVGDALPTVLEMQQEYNISQATVERALDRLRREGLINRPDGQLRLTVAEACDPAAHRVVMIRPDYPAITFEELSRVIIEAGKKKDWAFDLVSYRRLDGLNLRRAVGDNDGAILLPSSEPFPPALLNALRRPSKPVIVIQDPPPDIRGGSVRMDDRQMGKLAVDHLRSLGHRRILVLNSEPPSPSAKLRAAGWRDAMIAAGETELQSLEIDCHVQPTHNSLLQSYEYFNHWMGRPHPKFTGIFCPAWTGALSAMRVLRERNIAVPNQVSIVSHGGEGYLAPFLFPPLTAIETDLSVYGAKTIDLLQKAFDDLPEARANISIPSQLVVRGSTAPPPADAV